MTEPVATDPHAGGGRPGSGGDRRDRYRGCLLGGAVGDAMGRPAEGWSSQDVAARWGRLRDFKPWRGWTGGPVGTVTDDTQLTMLVADSLLACGRIDPADIAARLVEWLPAGRGIGTATRAAVDRLAAGVAWEKASEASDGNGAAMRVAPVGLVYAGDLDELRRAAMASSLPTHTGPTGLAATVAQAAAVAWVVTCPLGRLDPEAFTAGVLAALDGLDDPGVTHRRPGGGRVTIAGQLARLVGMADWSPAEVFDDLYNGALASESVPAAMWCFLASPDDPERVIETAVAGGRDADTVAAMAGALAGAWRGASALPDRWVDDLEYAEDLRLLADGLLALADTAAPAGGRP